MAVKVKKYDPNEYNFGNFADAMNKNFTIERTQNLGGAAAPAPAANLANPVNLGGTTNSQTLGNLPQIEQNAGGTFPSTKIGKGGIYRDITTSYKDMLSKIDLGEQASYTSPFAVKPGAENNTVDTEPVVVPEGSTKEATQTVAPTVQSGETSLPQGVPTAPETDISTGKLDFATWQSTYSVDPAEEYKAAQEQLDYEFKTWMSTYGARAEQLYQMGLSNSGVSDIYGANAYSAYIQASLDLKRAQIEQEQENKALYAQYSAEYDAQQTSMTSAAFNSYAASYTPDQEQSVRVALEAQGLTSEQVESAIAQLNNYYNSLPEEQKPDVIAKKTKVNEALNWMYTQYNSGITDIKALTNQMSIAYGEDVATAAAEKFQTLAGKTNLTSYIDNADIIQISFSNLYGILENARVEHGKDSETFKEIQKSVQNKANEVFQLALNNDYELKRAYSLVGMDLESWSQLSDEAKMEKIMTAVGEYASMGLINTENASALYDEWFKNELEIMYETINQVGITLGEKYNYLDKIIAKVEEYNKAGYLDKEKADEWLKQLKTIREEEREETANTNLRNWALASQPQPIGPIDYSDIWSIIDAIGKAIANSKMS